MEFILSSGTRLRVGAGAGEVRLIVATGRPGGGAPVFRDDGA